MSGRRKRGLSPSLFPFLAVLVCTLGTLILLLALVAQNASDAAAQQKAMKADQPEEVDETRPILAADAADRMIEEERFRVEQLVSFRDAQTTEIGERKDQLTHLENHIARIKQDLKRLSDQFEMATGTKKIDKVDEAELASLRRQINEESEKLEKLKEEKGDGTPRVVIVPHKGPNGTSRRPIYLECDADGLTIQPEGTRISLQQLLDSEMSANPLDAALRVIRHHAMQVYGDTVAPYPMLVVRPDGIDSYFAARGAMRDWDDQFGYEMVPAEVKLAFDQPDARLKQIVAVAIRESVQQQTARHAIAARGPGGDRFGSSYRRGASRTGRRFPTLSAKQWGREGRAAGFRSSDDSLYAGTNYGGTNYGGAPENHAAASDQMDDRFRSAMDDLKANRNDAPNSNGVGGGATGANEQHQDSDFVRSNPFGPYSSGDIPPSTGSLAAEQQGTREHGPSDGNDASERNNASQWNDVSNANDPPQGRNQLSQDERSSAGDPASENGLVNSAKQQVAAILRGETAGDSNQSGGRQSESSRGKSSGNRQAASLSQAAGDSSNANTSRAASAVPSAPNSAQPSASPQQSPSVSVTASRMDPDTLVKRQGNDWALPRSVARSHGNAIVRTIRMQCYRDRLVLLPSRQASSTEVFGLDDGDVMRATLELATAVRNRVERWGAAIPGGRWQPRLVVEVMPEGETRYHQIRTLMNGSGVDVEGRSSE